MGSNFASQLESHIALDRFLISTLISYIAVAAFFVNITILKSSALGLIATTIYFLVNGVFLGNAFFAKENGFLRLMLGILLLVMLLGLVGWVVIIVTSLNTLMLTLVLVIAATASSMLKRMMGTQNER